MIQLMMSQLGQQRHDRRYLCMSQLGMHQGQFLPSFIFALSQYLSDQEKEQPHTYFCFR